MGNYSRNKIYHPREVVIPSSLKTSDCTCEHFISILLNNISACIDLYQMLKYFSNTFSGITFSASSETKLLWKIFNEIRIISSFQWNIRMFFLSISLPRSVIFNQIQSINQSKPINTEYTTGRCTLSLIQLWFTKDNYCYCYSCCY